MRAIQVTFGVIIGDDEDIDAVLADLKESVKDSDWILIEKFRDDNTSEIVAMDVT
jgi:hypothetical protein